MSIVVSILGAWAILYGLYYKTYERSLLQGIYVTLVRRVNVSARQLVSAPQDVGQEQDCRLGEIENASP